MDLFRCMSVRVLSVSLVIISSRHWFLGDNAKSYDLELPQFFIGRFLPSAIGQAHQLHM